MPEELAHEIVEAIIRDLTDRKGLRQEWDMIDGEIQDEIRAAWADIIKERVK
jgi:hypothetical protein